MKLLLEIIALSAAALLAIRYVLTVLWSYQDIHDANGDVYLRRYFLYRPDWASKIGLDPKKLGRVYLHHLLLSDYDRALHDHPWTFRSIMLKGQYTEYTTVKNLYDHRGKHKPKVTVWKHVRWPFDRENVRSTFKAPCYLKRPATWRHRLELKPGETTWTLVFVGPKVRAWGFWTTMNRWCHWKSYNHLTGLCEEPETHARME